MTVERTVRCLVAACALAFVAALIGNLPVASAATVQCAQTAQVVTTTADSPVGSTTLMVASTAGVPPSGTIISPGQTLGQAPLKYTGVTASSFTLSAPTTADIPAGSSLTVASTQTTAAVGRPCWTDSTPYPFGSDGNPVDPTSGFCTAGGNFGPNHFGPNWLGDFNVAGNAVDADPPCYEQVTSMAFRAWNRGLAATQIPTTKGSINIPFAGSNPFGVWLYNGTGWFPDPTFPGSGVCPGHTILWAGKLDYWLIGGKTLCRFDGVNLFWQPLTLPAQTLAHLGTTASGQNGNVTAGTCFAWDNCWFFGPDGIEVHWDGQQLTDETSGLGTSPWLQGDFTAAAGVATASGTDIGVAANSGQMSVQPCAAAQGGFCTNPAPDGSFLEQGSGTACPTAFSCPTPPSPDGSQPPTAFSSAGGSWSPLSFGPPDQTIVTTIGMDGSGDAWAATQPQSVATLGTPSTPNPVPLVDLAPTCSGYASETSQSGVNDMFTFGATGRQPIGLQWTSVGVAPDAGVIAAGQDTIATTVFQNEDENPLDPEPVVVQGACGRAPTVTEFRVPDPLDPNQSTASLVPADEQGSVTAVSAPATNDVWAATNFGDWGHGSSNTTGLGLGGPQRPHLYQLTDGQPPNAPAGDDNETRPSLFTLSPPVFQVESSTVTVAPSVTTTTTKKKGTTKRKQLKPAVYGVRTKLEHGGTRKQPTYTLHLSFKLRRPTTVGLEALHGNRVVARAPMRRFTGRTGELSIPLNRKAWPTRLKLTTPKGQKGAGSSAPQPKSQK